MTTFAPDRDGAHRHRELDELTRRAWADYRDSLRELSGRAYEDAEHRSWQRLQRKLHDLAGQRDAIVAKSDHVGH